MSSPAPQRSARGKRKLIEGEDVPDMSTTSEGVRKRSRSSKTRGTIPAPESSTSTLEQGSGHFAGAHNFVISNLTMYDGIPRVNEERKEALVWLSNHVIRGAEVDSSERDPPPRCHPQTRLAVRSKILEWLHDPKRKINLLWLHGPAGVGKSAIIQTLAESEKSSRTLGAAVFFSRPNRRDNLKRLLPTVAYQLAVKLPSYQDFICEQMGTDPLLLERGMAEQFNKLIVEPFASRGIRPGSPTLPILLDGLDECQDEVAQREIVELVGAFVREHPTVPLAWVISSRPELHLQVAFSSENIRSNYVKEYIHVDSEQACRDVERFLRTEFENIRRRYPYSIPSTSEWPTESQILVIASAASGLFIFAVTLIRFIGDGNFGDPDSQLELVLLVLERLRPTTMIENPLAALDMLYSEILSRIPDSVLSVTKRILGYVLLQSRDRTPSFIHTCNLLNLKQNVAYGAFQKLHSVVQVPSPEQAVSKPLHIFHASFTDYLCNRNRSQKFWIDRKQATDDIWRCYFRILQQAKIEGPFSVSNIPFSWQPIGTFSHIITLHLFDEAALCWAHQILPEPSRCSHSRPYTDFPTGGYLILPDSSSGVSKRYDRRLATLRASELYDIIQQIDFSKLYHGYLCSVVDKWEHYVLFLRWLCELRSHPELKRRKVVEVLCISDVDMDRVIIDRINYPPRIYRKHGKWLVDDISPDASIEDTWEFHHKEALKERLQLLRKQNPSTPCAIWGVDPLKKCLIVEYSRMPDDNDSLDSEIFLLPYV